jgi:hypothetical protein
MQTTEIVQRKYFVLKQWRADWMSSIEQQHHQRFHLHTNTDIPVQVRDLLSASKPTEQSPCSGVGRKNKIALAAKTWWPWESDGNPC